MTQQECLTQKQKRNWLFYYETQGLPDLMTQGIPVFLYNKFKREFDNIFQFVKNEMFLRGLNNNIYNRMVDELDKEIKQYLKTDNEETDEEELEEFLNNDLVEMKRLIADIVFTEKPFE